LVSALDRKMEADGDECDIRAPEVGDLPSSSGIAPKAKATKDKKRKGRAGAIVASRATAIQALPTARSGAKAFAGEAK
jgi:hypothetical protein